MFGSPRKQVYVPYASMTLKTINNQRKQIHPAPMQQQSQLQQSQLHLQPIHPIIKSIVYLYIQILSPIPCTITIYIYVHFNSYLTKSYKLKTTILYMAKTFLRE